MNRRKFEIGQIVNDYDFGNGVARSVDSEYVSVEFATENLRVDYNKKNRHRLLIIDDPAETETCSWEIRKGIYPGCIKINLSRCSYLEIVMFKACPYCGKKIKLTSEQEKK